MKDEDINPEQVISFESTRGLEEAALGAKALSLVRLSGIGLPVPPGFCILASAYREHFHSSGLLSRVQSALEQLGAASPEARGPILAALRQEIIATPLSPELESRIADHYHRLAADRVAVRSSATAEDLPGHSFAGQYDTFLGAADLAGCLAAIKRCWASLWTERAYAYRERNGFDHLDLAMAVIVQKLVQAEVAGVLFTADPVTGRSDRIVIEACFGLGEALVSGKVSPDRLIVAKANLRLLSHTIAEKSLQTVLDESGGTREQRLAPGQAGKPCLDQAAARRLAKLALKAEAGFGSPQDMEWAVVGREIFFLQARPITTLPPKKTWEDRQVWSNINTGEILPDVVTPLTWSLLDIPFKKMVQDILSRLGMDLGDHPLVGQVAGRVYFNLNTAVGMVRCFPGSQNIDLTKILGGKQENMEDLGRLEIPEEDIPDLSFHGLTMALKLPGLLVWVLSHSLGRGEVFVAETRKRVEEFQRINLNSLSDQALLGRIQTAIAEVFTSSNFLAFPFVGMACFTALDKLCRKWLQDSDGALANRLASGVGGMDSAEAGFALWRLAVSAQQHPALAEALWAKETWETARKKIANHPGGREFLADWNAFMAEHGHHTRGELELFNRRWCEQPDYILGLVRGYLGGLEKTDPLANYQRRREERDRMVHQCRQLLRNPIQRRLFNFWLPRAQRGVVLRENIKSMAMRFFTVIRFLFLELGQRLVRRGHLEDVEDIFFLRLEEVELVARGEANFEVKKIVAERRAEHEKNLAITPPPLVIGKFDPDHFVPLPVEESVEIFRGIAVSPGVVTGPARVILRASTAEQVLPGEILVAPFTDPGWTPYFITAAAIVMDQGGLLSHGSIVAREYGIPAVVNVGPATKIIRTGQMIQVDGNRGQVRILKDFPHPKAGRE